MIWKKAFGLIAPTEEEKEEEEIELDNKEDLNECENLEEEIRRKVEENE